MSSSRSVGGALDHVVVVLFENRSLDNVLGHLYGPGDGKTFEGVIGKELSNPIPEWAEHGAERKTVPYTVATDIDAPNPDSGEEYFHTNTQLFNILDERNRFKIGEAVSPPWNAPEPGAVPTMDGDPAGGRRRIASLVCRFQQFRRSGLIKVGRPGTDVLVKVVLEVARGSAGTQS